MTFTRRLALDSFVGADRAAVIQRLGSATSDSLSGHSELLTYDNQVYKFMPGEPATHDILGDREGPWVSDSHCSTTFRLTDGKVDAWRLQGNDCSETDSASLGGDVQPALKQASEHGIDSVAPFPHDEFTGISVVRYGKFQSE
jgi:hypothetical protein